MYILFLDDAVHEGPPLDGPLSGLERHYKDRSKCRYMKMAEDRSSWTST